MNIADCRLRVGDSANDAVIKMNRAMRHRGPDDQGIADFKFAIPNSQSEIRLVLGNTRLAIIDTSAAGHQPMLDHETSNWITYNGETYNFRELRREIGEDFGAWQSNTDTEVVLRAYRKWGIEAFKRLRGMFAVAIWDATKKELILARDRFGIKPLYYSNELGLRDPSPDARSSLIFASEVRALLASGVVQPKLNHDGVASYLEYGSVQGPLTIVEGVNSLMPGHYLRARIGDQSKVEIETHSFIEDSQRTTFDFKSRAEAVAQVRVKLEESVRAHLVSDVPLGVFLSGGMDSSALVALMSRVSKDKPKTFSIVFDEEQYTEAAESRAVARSFQTEHCEVHLSEERLLEMLPDAVAALDQPSMDGINTFVVSKAVKTAGVTVALSGLGGDELFAGYPSFTRALTLQETSAVAKRVLRKMSAVGKVALNGSVQRNKFWQLMSSNGQAPDVYRITRQLFAPNAVRKLMSVSSIGVHHEVSCSSDDPINAMSELESRGYMANTLLRDTDAMSMAHSLEVRVPLVDSSLVDLVRSLPGDWKLSRSTGRVPKPLLADALNGLFAKDFLRRPKMGFTLPFEKWMQSKLSSEISSRVADTTQLSKSGLDPDSVSEVWNRFKTSPRTVGWARPWSLYILTRWCLINGVSS